MPKLKRQYIDKGKVDYQFVNMAFWAKILSLDLEQACSTKHSTKGILNISKTYV